MSSEIFHTKSAEEMRALGAQFAEHVSAPKVITLSGELGAGKTTFSQGFLSALGSEGPFTSPTFVLMKRYDLLVPKQGIECIYHADAYRVGEDEFRSLGWEEWIRDPKGIVLLEWPERIPGLVPKNALRILFETEGDGRKVCVQMDN